MSCCFSRRQPPSVIPPSDASQPERFAAAELKTYLSLILSVSLPDAPGNNGPRIILTRGDDPKLGEEGYEITVDSRGCRLHGGGPAGVVYGAYAFLREYAGCRFSSLGKEYEYVPRRECLELAEGTHSRTPELWYRGMQFSFKEDLEAMVDKVDWMAKNGLNTVRINPAPDPVQARQKEQAMLTRDPATGRVIHKGRNRFTTQWFREHILPEIVKRGMRVDRNGHNFLDWLPPDRHFGAHPEWYALIDGQRVAKPYQLCLCTSNEAMVETLIENVKQYLRDNPDVGTAGVIQEDYQGMCQCETCRALDPDPNDAFAEPLSRRELNMDEGEPRSRAKTLRYARLVNRVARAVRDEFPDRLIGYSAYGDLHWPPQDLPLESNVQVQVALYWRCGVHPIAPDACRINDFFYRLLDRWTSTHTGPVILYEYYCGMSAQHHLPYPQAEVICRDWPRLKQLGIRGATLQGAAADHHTHALNYLTFARNGWSAKVDAHEVLDDFLQGMFHGAAPAIRPIYERLLDTFKRVEDEGPNISPYLRKFPADEGCLLPDGLNIAYMLDQGNLEVFKRWADHAASVADDREAEAHVRTLRTLIDCWAMAAGIFKKGKEAGDLAAQGKAQKAASRQIDLFLELATFCAKARDELPYGWLPPWARPCASFPAKGDTAKLMRAGWGVFEADVKRDCLLSGTCDGDTETDTPIIAEAFTGRRCFRVARHTMTLHVNDPSALKARFNGRPLDPAPGPDTPLVWQRQDGPQAK